MSSLNFSDLSSQQGMTISPINYPPSIINGVKMPHPNKPIFPEGLGLDATPKQNRHQIPSNANADVSSSGISKRDSELSALNVKKDYFNSNGVASYGMSLGGKKK